MQPDQGSPAQPHATLDVRDDHGDDSQDEAVAATPLSPSSRSRTQASLGVTAREDERRGPPAGWWARAKAVFGVVWRRAKAEFWAELPLLKPRLLVILLCLVFQYVHAIFTTLAYHLHEPLPEPLHDIGFEIFPALGQDNDGISEAFVYTGFGIFAAWLLSPFVTRAKSFHSAVVFKRVLVILVTCQTLRIISFLSTQIPAPNYHCRAGEPTATLPWPAHWWQNIIINVSRQASKSCGDLIFSSHTTFLLVFMWTYAVMGAYIWLKVASFLYVAATSCLIIASRKHYSVDIVVAWYVVPAFFFHIKRRWTTRRDDVASPDGAAILANALPTAAAAAGTANGAAAPASPAGPGSKASPSSPLGARFQLLMGKLRLSPPKAELLAARADSQHLLGEQQQRGAAERAGGAGSEGQTLAWAGLDLEAGTAAAAAAAEESVHARGDSSSGGTSGLIPASPSKRPPGAGRPGSARSVAAGGTPGGGSQEPLSPAPAGSSPVMGAVRGIVSQVRGLPHRVGQLRRSASGGPGGSGHQRSGSTDSSTVALREGGAASSSAPEGSA